MHNDLDEQIQKILDEQVQAEPQTLRIEDPDPEC